MKSLRNSKKSSYICSALKFHPMAKSNFIIHRTTCRYDELPNGVLYAFSSRSHVIRCKGKVDFVVEYRGQARRYLCPVLPVDYNRSVYLVSSRYV